MLSCPWLSIKLLEVRLFYLFLQGQLQPQQAKMRRKISTRPSTSSESIPSSWRCCSRLISSMTNWKAVFNSHWKECNINFKMLEMLPTDAWLSCIVRWALRSRTFWESWDQLSLSNSKQPLLKLTEAKELNSEPRTPAPKKRSPQILIQWGNRDQRQSRKEVQELRSQSMKMNTQRIKTMEEGQAQVKPKITDNHLDNKLIISRTGTNLNLKIQLVDFAEDSIKTSTMSH